MDAIRICKNVGFDGESFFCRRCGKAGFPSEASARGHLSHCRGTKISKGVDPALLFAPSPPAALGGSFGAYMAGPVDAGGPAGAGDDQMSAYGYNPELLWRQDVDRQLATLQNEYRHQVILNNQPKQENWFSRNLGFIVLGGIMLMALLSSIAQSSQCPVPADGSGTKRNSGFDIDKLSERVLNKAADTAISKGLGRLFR